MANKGGWEGSLKRHLSFYDARNQININSASVTRAASTTKPKKRGEKEFSFRIIYRTLYK
jgi:hypothetical protein